MIQQSIITNISDLYVFLDSPTPVYGLITAPIQMNFDFISNYRKVLNVDTSNIKLTASIFY